MAGTLWIAAGSAVALSYWKDPERTKKALRMSGKSVSGLVPGILGMITMVGLGLSLLPQHVITDLFSIKGLGGFLAVSAVGAFITMPVMIAFPLVGSLLLAGAPPAMLAAFVTTLTMVGTVSAPIEVSYFGLRFTIMRQVLSFISAVIIGLLMGAFL